jgi:hypothetical protein
MTSGADMKRELVVFFSYSSRDLPLRNAVELHVGHHQQRGDQVDDQVIKFISDQLDLPAGSELERWIDNSIIDADVLLTIVTASSVASWWVAHELFLARRYARPILVVIEQGIDITDLRLPPWLREYVAITFQKEDLVVSERLRRLAGDVASQLAQFSRARPSNAISMRPALSRAHRELRSLREVLQKPSEFQQPFRAEHAHRVLEAAVREVKKLTGNDYQQDLSLQSAFIVRAEPIFQQASATYATSVDFVSTFWEKEANRLAPRYLQAQTNEVKRLFVFSSPRDATRHLNVVAAHHKQYGRRPGGCVLLTSSERYAAFMDKIAPEGTGGDLRKGDFAILAYGDAHERVHYEARLTEDSLTCHQVESGLSDAQKTFIDELDRIAKDVEPGDVDAATGIVRWKDSFAGQHLEERREWKQCLTSLFQPSSTDSPRDRDVFHLVFFSRNVALDASDIDRTAAARKLREAISEAVDALLKLRNPRKQGQQLIKELWFGDFNQGLRSMNIADGRFKGQIRTAGLFVDNFPYCLMMRFDTRADLEYYYKHEVHSEAREKIFKACDPFLTKLYDTILHSEDLALRKAVYEAVEAAASRCVVRADYVEHEDIDWIVEREQRIAFGTDYPQTRVEMNGRATGR